MVLDPTNQNIQQVHYAHMRVISKPPSQTRQVAPRVGPIIKGDGNMTYLCGDCETTLLETVGYKLARELVVKCKQCGCNANGSVIRWYFADPDAARDFASEFGGCGTITFHRLPASLLALSDF